jgi:hypothetical protein
MAPCPTTRCWRASPPCCPRAEGTDNTHEAEAFMAAAQRLATATSIDLAVARSHSAMRTAAQAPVQRTIGIGTARKLH